MKVTEVQLALIREGVRPGLYLYGSGGGKVIADPRTIRALIKHGLAWRPDNRGVFNEWRDKAYLTRKAFELVGAEPPKRHPCDNDKAWP